MTKLKKEGEKPEEKQIILKKYILAGGPGGGKAEILKYLKKEKFYYVENAASNLINKEMEKKIPESQKLLPWTNPGLYQERVLKNYIEWVTKPFPKNVENVFIEGWLVDQQAHWEANNMEVPQKLLDEIAAEKNDFTKIFLIELLPDYKQTETRKYTFEQTLKIHDRIKELYSLYGFNFITIKPDTPKNRADFILNEIGYKREEEGRFKNI